MHLPNNIVETVCTPSLQVELLVLHVLERFLWHEMPHVASFLDALADEGGRNLNNRGLQYGYGRVVDEMASVVTLSGEHQKFIVVQYFLVFVPVFKALKTVHSTDEDKLVVGVLYGEG